MAEANGDLPVILVRYIASHRIKSSKTRAAWACRSWARRSGGNEPRPRFGITVPADPHPVTARQLDIDVVLGGRDCRGRPGLRDDLYRQKARLLCREGDRGGVRRITGIAQPLQDQIGIHRVAPRHLSHGDARRRRLETDRPLLLVCPEPLRPTRHDITIVSTIVCGHYPLRSGTGRAVSPDGYLETLTRC